MLFVIVLFRNLQVYIDNHDVKEINLKYLRKHIGVVSQEPVLFDTSIKENIRMGHSEATEEMIINAAKNANAHDFISKLPQVKIHFLACFVYLHKILKS